MFSPTSFRHVSASTAVPRFAGGQSAKPQPANDPQPLLALLRELNQPDFWAADLRTGFTRQCQQFFKQEPQRADALIQQLLATAALKRTGFEYFKLAVMLNQKAEYQDGLDGPKGWADQALRRLRGIPRYSDDTLKAYGLAYQAFFVSLSLYQQEPRDEANPGATENNKSRAFTYLDSAEKRFSPKEVQRWREQSLKTLAGLGIPPYNREKDS